MRLFMYNKGLGDEIKETVFTPEGGEEVKLYPVLGLSKETTRGLVLFTDDASKVEELSKKLEASEMQFHVTTKDHLNTPIIQAVRAGIDLPDGSKSPACKISWTEANGYVLDIKPCSEEFLKELTKAMGTEALQLKRFRAANFKYGKLALREFAECPEEEVNKFLAM